jgi:amino acid adenylation domain-containing protein
MNLLREAQSAIQSGDRGLNHCASPFVEFDKADIEQSIAARFERQARQYPDRIAVKTYSRGLTQELTYDELNRAANRVAHAVLAHDDRGNQPIALLFKQGVAMTVASLGALKAGKAYAPVDYRLPQAGARQILRHLPASLILTDGDNFKLARELSDGFVQILNVDELDANLPDNDCAVAVSPDRIAYIHFTSGSTGAPKGVAANHRSELHNIMKNTNALKISPDDRVSLLRSNNAGAARDTWLALLNGAALCPLELGDGGLAGLGRWLTEEQITVLSCVTTVYRHALSSLSAGERVPTVRLIHIGGEPVTKNDVEAYKNHFTDSCVFVVRYSISETPAISYFFIDKQTEIAEEHVPVGYPLDGNEIFLLDDDGHEVAVGQSGEIAVKSCYLAVGYWRQPELTREKFRADGAGGKARVYRTGDLGYLRPDGCLVHMGRKDFQTKIRGHRVEVSEVELALLGIQGIKQVAVVARDDDGDGRRLIAYVIPQEGRALTVSALRASLEEKLPSYMQPSSFVILESFPLTASGKVDRRALPPPARSRQQLDSPYASPKNSIEKVLASLWAEVLGVAEVGIHDDFAQLGGDSLLGARIVVSVNEMFSPQPPLKLLIETPTVARLAGYLIQQERTPGEGEKIAEIVLKVDAMSADEIGDALDEK